MSMKTRLLLAGLVCIAAATTSVPDALLARQENVPGMPTIARTYILNQGPGEAVPVAVHATADAIPVAVISGPAVALEPGTVVLARDARQSWEYRHLRVGVNEDPTEALNAEGEEGWEAVGAAAGGAGSTVWVLKRPRP